MLIGIISDTHDNAANLLKAIRVFNMRKVDLVVHCGDWVSPFMPDFCNGLDARMVSIFGNNETDKGRFKNPKIAFHPRTAELDLHGTRVFVCHGHIKRELDMAIESQRYDLVCSGHTHSPLIRKHGKTLHVNPGSTSGVRNSMLVKEKTVAIYDTSTAHAEMILF
jgi:uncharacterized protein